MSYSSWLLKGRTLLREKLYVKGGMMREKKLLGSFPSIAYKCLLPVFKKWEV